MRCSLLRAPSLQAVRIMLTAVLLLWNIGVVWADQQITDPKRWCDNLMSIIAEKDTVEVAQEFHDSAGGRVKREDVDAALASLGPTLALAGSFVSRDLVIERRYGQSVADFTYVLFFDSIDLFFRCRLHKRDNYWRAAALSFNSNLDNLEPP